MKTAVSLFSGVGSSSKALRDLGYDVLPHDFNADAVASLVANGFENAVRADVRNIDWSTYPQVDVLEGGPPCQPFSQSHDGAGKYDPRDMIPEFIRAVAELRPRLFLMEEVPSLTWKRHREYLDRVLGDLRALGYTVEARVLNAADYGHGQARKRLFVLGSKLSINWPNPRDYTPRTMAGTLGWDGLTCFQRNWKAPQAARLPWVDQRYLWPMNRASTTVVGSFRPEVQAAPGYRKAGDGPRQNTPGSVVTTLEERLVLQDLPRDWVVVGSQSSRDLQVGNSVVCGLVRDLIGVNS